MDDLQKNIDAYRDEHWDEIIADIEALVKVESTESLEQSGVNAPFGPGPRQALDRALEIAERMGLETHDCEGRIGYADLPGESDIQIGIIGHVDVVPAGPGWTSEPYGVTRRDGYLLGRGVIDDKGPLMVALHAVNYWKGAANACGKKLPYTIRVLFGANEETNMKDVEYYRAHHDDPAFLFTPDSQFPLGYGESGICSGTLTSAPFHNGDIMALQGGQAVNAVPGEAWACVRRSKLGEIRGEEFAGQLDIGGITLTSCSTPTSDGKPMGNHDAEELVKVEARGVSAHASTPELGVNAIGLLANYLYDAGVGTTEERAFLELLCALHGDTAGTALGIACSDGHFGALTAVGGVINLKHLEDGGSQISQSVDFRYPTSIESGEIAERMSAFAATAGASFSMEHDKQPFLMNPESPAVRALLDAYCTVTGEEARGLTSKGGTYARCFTTGVSFGPEKPWLTDPDWVGGMHGPDEGVSEDLLRQAFSIYARALGNLMECEL